MSEKSQKDQEDRMSKSQEQRLFVTLRAERGHKEVDLEIPADQPIGEWMADLVKILNWPPMDPDRPLNYRLRTTTGRVLSDQDTLNDARINPYDVLWISLIEPDAEADETDFSDQDEHLQEMEQTPEHHFEGTESVQRDLCLSITEPSLVSASGMVFALGDPPILIGRRSSKHQPDIDLTELDDEYAASRRHAMVLKDEDHWMLLARETTNGTFLNGTRLSPGDMHTLKDGDVIQFGQDGVELLFCSGEVGS